MTVVHERLSSGAGTPAGCITTESFLPELERFRLLSLAVSKGLPTTRTTVVSIIGTRDSCDLPRRGPTLVASVLVCCALRRGVMPTEADAGAAGLGGGAGGVSWRRGGERGFSCCFERGF